jgi:hypothetical protein
VGAGRQDAAAVPLRRCVRAAPQLAHLAPHVGQRRQHVARDLELAGGDLALRPAAQQRDRLRDDVRGVREPHRLGVDEVVLLLDTQGGSDVGHHMIVPHPATGGQRRRFACMEYALFLPIFDELADARGVAQLAAEAEQAGWDGVFVWDHVAYRAPVQAVADPWVVLAAVAMTTERVRIGPMVTPLARRRPVKLAREVATLDRLSGGRLVLGVGLGGDGSRELSATGEQTDDRVRAACSTRRSRSCSRRGPASRCTTPGSTTSSTA